MNEKILENFISIVGVKNIITSSKDLEKYNRDWRGFYKNSSCKRDLHSKRIS